MKPQATRKIDAMKSQKTALLANKSIKPLPDFSTISCAWPTDMGNRGPTFDAFALANNLALDAHRKQADKSSYNQVVTTCLTCHQAMCPGPIGALNGLFFDPETGAKAQTSCGE